MNSGIGSSLLTLEAAQETLRERLHAARTESDRHGILRLEVEVVAVELLPWLAAQSADQLCFWSDRRSSFAMAGVGECDSFWHPAAVEVAVLLEEIRKRLRHGDSRARYYGGMAFAPTPQEARAGEWLRYGAARFAVPRIELLRRDARMFLACNLLIEDQGDWTREIAAAEAGLCSLVMHPARQELPHVRLLARTHQPDVEGWRRMFDLAMEALAGGNLQKVVLARSSTCQLDRVISPTLLLQRLEAITPNCFHFCFQLEPGEAFLGATPELLCERTGRHLSTEAIAGTRRRGVTPEEDECLGLALLKSGKDRREHQFVVDSLEQALRPLCTGLEKDEANLLKLARVQHLCQHMCGEVREGVTDADLIGALHPTPAVGGWPTDAAKALIESLEPFDRGWYAGPVGWIGADSLQLGVGIRSGRLSGRQLSLYSGAGLVQDSEAANEWQEIEDKVTSFLSGLLEV